MFNYVIDNSFYDYLHEINPDLAIIQEARFNRLKKTAYSTIFPNGYDKDKIKSTIHLTVAFCKEDWKRDDSFDFKRYNYSHIRLKKNTCLILGVHTPKIEKKELNLFEKYYSADIICGDFNTSSKNTESLNYKLYQKLTYKDYYCDLWKTALRNEKAYYCNYKGEKLQADEDRFFRTFSGNTHIDYVLGKSDLKIKEIIIDYRTLAFTDHTSIIIDIEENKCY